MRPTVSVVIPAYNEAGSLPWLLPAVLETLDGCGVEPTVFVVDDGSTDATSQATLEMRAADDRVHLIRLSRNFGHQAALLAGLRAAAGDAVICMDGDGQHPPHVLEELIEQWRAGSDVVHTTRADSADVGRAKRLSGRLFYRVFRWFSGLELSDGMADFRLMSRRALDATLAVVGRRPFFRGAAVWIGFAQTTVAYGASDRTAGRSSYSPGSMARLARDGIVGFSARPLWILSSVGLVGSLVAFLIALYAVVVGLLSDQAVPGWASTLGVMAVLLALVFVLLGAFGVYIGAVFAEVLDRPTFIVAAVDEETTSPAGAPDPQRTPGHQE